MAQPAGAPTESDTASEMHSHNEDDSGLIFNLHGARCLCATTPDACTSPQGGAAGLSRPSLRAAADMLPLLSNLQRFDGPIDFQSLNHCLLAATEYFALFM
jgi:hypothetical protein